MRLTIDEVIGVVASVVHTVLLMMVGDSVVYTVLLVLVGDSVVRGLQGVEEGLGLEQLLQVFLCRGISWPNQLGIWLLSPDHVHVKQVHDVAVEDADACGVFEVVQGKVERSQACHRTRNLVGHLL